MANIMENKAKEMVQKSLVEQLQEIEVEIICNKCGAKFKLDNHSSEGIMNQGKISHKSTYFGYGSEFDGTALEYNLCNDCEMEFTKTFMYPLTNEQIVALYSDEHLEELQKAYAQQD